ncbi:MULTISPECIES: efflux RND transporter permease subunit [unclassified Oceanispirochaeta]|uniref:efflux RND transporter permease subunit n=1 Tax=unclassified Oceanispirochaeta TaxID=2635722 RepID=UPI000E0966B8|nr:MULTISPECIES: efflux RND transporter permease subunit [unclassified Oceanispirochaeta]MBF9018587.1 efflux RND transporter permease subunit [Oceanispirochaeta sp. M2]NPD75006.1 efflux RND transporter permease subunit [Oceanispirochaeta sp. M1]RDG29127.1 AcrB/AcrD/AcrF family protein [Oceanispirochaeta sp. M1]
MNIFKFILKHPLAVITLFCLMSILGLLMVFSIPMDLYPEFNPPVLTVVTIYPQATPEEVEDQITRPLEESLGSLSGLDQISSYSGNSVSRIVLEFNLGLDMISIENDIRSRLGQLQLGLPAEAEIPVLYKFDMNDEPIVELAIRASEGRDLQEIYSLSKKDIKSSFEQLEGVAAAELKGIREELVEVSVIRNRLEAFSLNLTILAGMISGQNRKLGSGSLDEDGIEYSIQADGEFSSLDDIRTTVLSSSPGGGSIRVQNLAAVYKTLEDPDDLVTLDGTPAIRISILKQSDANVVQTTDRVLAHARVVNETLPDGFELIVVSESTGLIRLVISTIMSSGLLGGLLAMSVILFFLHRIRPTIIIFISIPVSLLIAVGVLGVMGKTLNILTMGGLILGLGMIVDGSIVVLENIMGYFEKGVPLKSAAMQGAREMASPITGSTLTSICVFLPLLFMADDLDILGVMFKDMALSVILALSASLAVSLFLVPVLSLLLLGRKGGRTGKGSSLGHKGYLSRGIEKFLTVFEGAYVSLLGKALKNRGLVLITALVLLLSSFLLVPHLGWKFLPNTGEESFIVDVEFPMGTSLGKSEEILLEISGMMKEKIPWLKAVLVTADTGGGRIKGILPPLDQRALSYEEMKSNLRSELQRWPEGDFEFISTDMATEIGNSGKLIVLIKGESLDDMIETEENLAHIFESRDEILEFSSDREKPRPELSISFFRDRAFELGISMEQGAAEVRAALTGLKATEFREDGESLDVVVRLRPEDRSGRQDLQRVFLMNPRGVRVPLSNIARLEEGTIPGGIRRDNQTRTFKLSATVDPQYEVDELQSIVQSLIASQLILPDGVQLGYGGEMEDVETYGKSLIYIFALAVLLVFAVMVCQFESLKSPFIIILVLPFMFIGIILIFLLMGLAINMITIIAAVMLAGIVVNNGIVMVDYTKLLRDRGACLENACLESGRSRLRPVLMTTLTTILAMVPIGFFPGEGGAMLQPLGMTIVGGLAISTVATLFLIPVLYSLFHRREEKAVEKSVV